MEGPIDPAELVEILQRTMEEQGSASGTAVRGREEEHMRARIKEEERIRARTREQEKLRADRQLREEQDAAYFVALQRDQVCAYSIWFVSHVLCQTKSLKLVLFHSSFLFNYRYSIFVHLVYSCQYMVHTLKFRDNPETFWWSRLNYVNLQKPIFSCGIHACI